MKLLSYLFPQLLSTYHSKINGEIKVVESFGRRAIYVDGAPQSGAEIWPMWEKIIKNLELKIKNCLILGVGGGDVIKIIRKYYPEAVITGVEIDPIMIDIARKYFNIKSSDKLKIIHADAFAWIKLEKKKFDLIIFDLYLGKFNPPNARTISFLDDLKKLSNDRGFILYNAHYQNDEEEYERLLKDCHIVFRHAELLLSSPYSRILSLR
ncbi:methyltransferase domain-containing protein [Candidatus Gottesmanbacteria bacterium]|nr:methyltransferase domain-containing protein [Candidatus Gottesmanbacteria bacterium]MBI5451863.1 methyltransferase domain-containing protein [Candidatus Gottesmanbacteria bacterium]